MATGVISLTGILGSEQCINGGELPTDAEKTASHAIPQAFVLPSHWFHPWSSYCHLQCPPAFLSFCLSSPFHKEISHLDRLETTIANSVEPLHPRFCLSSCAFPFPKVDRCRDPPPTGSGSGVRAGLFDQDSKGYEFCACGTGMTDVSLPIFPVEVQKRQIRRRQMRVQISRFEVGTNLFRWDHLGPPRFMAESVASAA